MDPLTEKDIRKSFVNCSKGEATRLRLPPDFPDTPWEDLDYLGWTDPTAPQRSLIVMPGAEGPLGILLRSATGKPAGAVKSSMCQICLTGHDLAGVRLLVAPRAGAAGRQGNSVGQYICADLACSLYLRGKRQPALRLVRHTESLTLQERVDRAMANLTAFAAKVTA
ncbi:FBP domain-containing protein [Streptomyces sp. WMMC1477]|uniref:FBP domain-containing protein n=1 Tax=Streptomyces sp. WMMC1477 TaxID=3015155 RepID=UPI0022B62061|nr:FBP domain-containing protein [Streptomyces sp. WMMC1477]MCZ7432884.1 FBP domain-containing protein [Streptomyces sp. WMMC1477]